MNEKEYHRIVNDWIATRRALGDDETYGEMQRNLEALAEAAYQKGYYQAIADRRG